MPDQYRFPGDPVLLLPADTTNEILIIRLPILARMQPAGTRAAGANLTQFGRFGPRCYPGVPVGSQVGFCEDLADVIHVSPFWQPCK